MKNNKNFKQIVEGFNALVKEYGYDVSFMVTIVNTKENQAVNVLYANDEGQAKLIHAIIDNNDETSVTNEIINISANIVFEKMKENIEFKKWFLKLLNEQTKHIN
jgi:hypothetical protein